MTIMLTLVDKVNKKIENLIWSKNSIFYTMKLANETADDYR